MKTATIIIPVYNGVKYLDLMRVTLPRFMKKLNKNINVVFRDDYSTDNPYLLLRELTIGKERLWFDGALKNKGAHEARKAGTKGCDTDYILFHDIDDPLDAGIINRMFERRCELPDTTHLTIDSKLMSNGIVWPTQWTTVPRMYIKYTLQSMGGQLPTRDTFISRDIALEAMSKLDEIIVLTDNKRIDVCEDSFLGLVMIVENLIGEVEVFPEPMPYNDQSGTNISQDIEKRVQNIPIMLAYCYHNLKADDDSGEYGFEMIPKRIHSRYGEAAPRFLAQFYKYIDIFGRL